MPGKVSDRGANWFEQQILESTGHIKFRYGMNTYDTSEWSNYYFGFIESYKCAFSNGVLKYTVAGISASVIANLDDIKDKDYYKINKSDTADKVLDKMEKLVNEDSSLKDYYVFDKEHSSKNFIVKEEQTVGRDNPMTYLNYIAQHTILDKDDSETYFYRIVVDDELVNGKGKISLKRFSKNKIDKVYTFEWGTRDCDVISWTPSYDGSVSLIFSRDDSKDKSRVTEAVSKLLEDEEGNTTGGTVVTPDDDSEDTKSGNFDDENTNIYSFKDSVSKNVTNLTQFLEASNYPYRASLTVLGLAGKKAENLSLISSNVEVIPMINGEKHHSAGIYQVLEITDNVSNGGFTTTLSLQRLSNQEGNTSVTLSGDKK